MIWTLENMNQDKAIFMRKCSALAHKNNEILIYILPFKALNYFFLISKAKMQGLKTRNLVHFAKHIFLFIAYQ